MRKSDNVDVGLGEDYEEALALADVGVGCNADLYYLYVRRQAIKRAHQICPVKRIRGTRHLCFIFHS